MDINCDICGQILNKEELKVLDELISDITPCYCDIAKELCKLRKL
jgi:hypothetical protein